MTIFFIGTLLLIELPASIAHHGWHGQHGLAVQDRSHDVCGLSWPPTDNFSACSTTFVFIRVIRGSVHFPILADLSSLTGRLKVHGAERCASPRKATYN